MLTAYFKVVNYEGCCELDFYFASEPICGCKPYIPRYKLDYKPPRTPLIPWQLPTRDYNDPSRRSSGKRQTSYWKIDSIYYGRDREFIIEDKKEETFEDENMEANVQVIEYHQLPDIKSNDVNNTLLHSMHQEE